MGRKKVDTEKMKRMMDDLAKKPDALKCRTKLWRKSLMPTRPPIAHGMAKRKMLEQTPTGMANKTGSDAVIPPGHAQRKSKL